ncbi:MAG TPA: helix-turn-helix domain-containing protein [Candidatus Saccharimonadales bacterium]|nr:helix-turn-helix domain-containing protein [Candidatus Saccharimonadales bacterium]
MKRAPNKSHCPVNYALESFGDSWTLLIVRDIVFWGKKTYGEFLESEEHIATNVLASRLAQMEQNNILTKAPCATDKRKEVYNLTNKGLDLIPIVLEMAGWGTTYDPETAAPKDFVAYAYAHRDAVFAQVRETVKNGGSLFAGADSVVRQLGMTK